MLKPSPTHLLLLLVLLIAGSCKQRPKTEIFHSPYNPRIAAFTSGFIPSSGTILVEFTDSVPGAHPGNSAPSSIASLTPRLSGKWDWVDHRTLRFVPASKLPSGTEWLVTLHLKKIFPDEKEDFQFRVATLPQNYRVTTDHLQPAEDGDYDNYKLTGKLTLADDITPEQAKLMLSATINGAKTPITWQHQDGTNHLFEIAPIKRGESAKTLLLSHTGKPVKTQDEGTIEIKIPAIGDFSIQSVETVQQPRQTIRVAFSSPLLDGQNLDGLIGISGNIRHTWMVTANLLEIFPAQSIYGEYELLLYPGIKSVLGDNLEETSRHQIEFSSLNPAVEFIGQGNILPYSDNLLLHFRSVSLKSVLVRVIKIYENNVPHFLQINTISGSSQLKRAGRLVHQSVISLDEDATLDLNRWNTFALDLVNFIQPEPGAIYRVELGFDRSYSVYPCADSQDAAPSQSISKMAEDGDFWDRPDDYYSEYPYYYEDWNWRERDNPCSNSYYRRSRWVSRNLLASNLGIIAKAGTGGEMQVFVTDLRNATPMQEVTLEVLNYQMQTLGTAKTSQEGNATITVKGKPFLLVAKKDKHRGYLRMDDGRNLSLSRFDVAGQTVREGLKGFIYGERGVWRPGDSIFISFIPEDKQNRLPANHPATFELINPQGQLVQRMVSRHPQNRIFTFRTATHEDAPTGFWLARVSLGDAVFEQSVRVETIKPNRLRINLDFGTEMLTAGKSSRLNLHSEWLHGAPASNLKAEVSMTLTRAATSFPKFTGFSFDDASRNFEPFEESILNVTLDNEGKTSFSAEPKLNQRAPGFLHASFTSRVFEEGGSFSIDRISIPYSPYSRYVGIRAPKGDNRGILLTDEDHNIEIVTINEKGESINIRDLRYTIYKINWRWWWDRNEEDLARYVSSGSTTIVTSGRVTTTDGKGNIKFRIDRPEWGRYLVRVSDEQGGHAATTTILVDWPGWAQKPGGIDADAASMLIFNSDKEQYQTGEKATVTFPSGDKGRALISIENGSRIVRTWWVQPTSGSTSFTFDVTEEMTPNVYVHISLLQPHRDKGNDLPIRMYGVLPIGVTSPASRLKPQIKTIAEWRPLQKSVVEVSEKTGQSMSYTLAVVDEGLLDLTRFRTPNPWDLFNAREALGVKTWDIYDFVLGAYGGRIERLFSIGGDDDLSGARADNKTRRFEPVVRFLGPFDLNRRGTNKHTIDIPNYTGSVRIMVVATNGSANGSAQQAVPIRQPLMIWSALPRVLGPGETVQLPVTIFASGKALGNVKVSVNTGNNLTCQGQREQTIRFDKDGEQTIFFELKAGDLIGFSKVEVKAVSGSESGSHEINMPIRNPNPPVTHVVSAVIAAGKKAEVNYQLVGIPGSNSSTMELSVIPPMDFGRRLKYLLDYPHGCIEQITSGAFPQIYLKDIVQMEPAMISKAQANVQSALSRLNTYQTNTGGFAYWAGGNRPDEWSSNYAGHFMLEAAKKGFNVPAQVRRNWVNYQKSMSASWVPDRSGRNSASDFIQAYRLFTLALAGETDMAGMNRLKQQVNLSNSAKWRLAATYALAGMGEVAKEIINALPESSSDKSTYYYTYGSVERDLAMTLETYVLLKEREKAARLARQLAQSLNSELWMSTQTTAYGLLALSQYASGQNIQSKDVKIQMQVNREKAENIGFSKPLYQQQLQLESTPSGKIILDNKSEAEVFANLILSGQPLRDTLSKAVSENLSLSLQYLDLSNRPIDIKSIGQGTDFKAIVTVHNPGPTTVANLALTQIFPSGWEIRNTRFEESGQTHELDQPDYRDIRDDRVYSYLDLKPGERKRLVTILHASYAGSFFLPAVSCEAMYDYSVRALVPGYWVEVKK
jgi:alpha-2-macroglobulin